jgi:hypothetical protein
MVAVWIKFSTNGRLAFSKGFKQLAKPKYEGVEGLIAVSPGRFYRSNLLGSFCSRIS